MAVINENVALASSDSVGKCNNPSSHEGESIGATNSTKNLLGASSEASLTAALAQNGEKSASSRKKSCGKTTSNSDSANKCNSGSMKHKEKIDAKSAAKNRLGTSSKVPKTPAPPEENGATNSGSRKMYSTPIATRIPDGANNLQNPSMNDKESIDGRSPRRKGLRKSPRVLCTPISVEKDNATKLSYDSRSGTPIILSPFQVDLSSLSALESKFEEGYDSSGEKGPWCDMEEIEGGWGVIF